MSSVALDPTMISDLVADEAPLRVAVYLADQNPDHDRSLGTTSMTQSLMAKLASRHDLALTQVISRSSYSVDRPSIETRRLPFRTDRTVGRLIAENFHAWLVRPQVDLWYYPQGYVSRLGGANRSIGTMHPTITQYYADHYPQSRSRRAFANWTAQTKRSLRRHQCVLTVSQHAADQLLDFCQRHSIDPPALKVTYQGSSWEYFRGLSFDKTDRVVHLASAAPHKGTNRLLAMWRQLLQKHELPPLTLIGNADSEGQQAIESLQGVTLLPPLSADDLRAEVGKARALLLPSEIAGFGLPALEAYYVGTPVVYVRDTAVCEVVQDPDHLGQFDLSDPTSFHAALDHVLALSAVQIRQTANRMYDRFAIDRICERIVRIMRECVTGY